MKHNKILQRKQASLPINYRYTRVNESGQLEDVRSLLDDRIVSGYAVMWKSINDYQERFVKGCFSRSIKENGPASDANYKIKLIDQHNRAVSLFAELSEDENGLYFKSVPLDDVQWANDLLVQLRSGTVNNFSIGFRHVWDKVQFDEENDTLIILEARLFEISAVDIPADMETYLLRSIGTKTSIDDETEAFISKLAKGQQLECRKLIAKNMSLAISSPPTRSAEGNKRKPISSGLNLNFITKNL